LVHRDVSPHNILVGVDGMARVVDFGIAKASGRMHTTREGAVKGKLGYMAPEQMAAENVTRQADLYAAAVVLWEALTGKRLFDGDSEAIVLAKVLTGEVRPPSESTPGIPPELDAIVMKGLTRKVVDRFTSGREFAMTLEKLGPAPLGEVGDWVEETAPDTLGTRAQMVADVETGSGGLTPMQAPDGDGAPAAGGGKAQSAQSGSIRPTALDDGDEGAVSAPPIRPKAPRWVLVAVGATLFASVVGVWAITSPGGGGGAAHPAASAVPTTEPVATAAPPTAPSAAVTATATATESALAAESSAPPALSASAAPTTSAKLWGKLPTGTAHTGGSPFNLGGRN
jgi:serine/threonine-protein kinase